MRKELIDYKGRCIDFTTIDKISFDVPEKNKPGKFIIKAHTADKFTVIYQSIGTEDTWHYNKLEVDYIIHSITEYLKLTEEKDNQLSVIDSQFNMIDIIDFTRTKLFKTYNNKIIELHGVVAELESKLQCALADCIKKTEE
jgi:SMC interacting uncharacterized protein involved in chromosome segregation